MSTAAVVEINVKTMSNKMNTRQEKTKAKTTEAEQKDTKNSIWSAARLLSVGEEGKETGPTS